MDIYIFFLKPQNLFARQLSNCSALATLFTGEKIFTGEIIHSRAYKAKIEFGILLYETIDCKEKIYVLCKCIFSFPT